MRDALSKSVNRATVDLAMKVGLDRIVETASAFGFSTPLNPYPSIALGSLEVVPLELARAYCAFAADGVLPHPLSLKDVVDEKGEVLERRHMAIQSVTTPGKAFLITSMLESTVEQGTASSLKDMGILFPAAGKTGTTNDFKDGWFVGYTPDVLVLLWVGFDDGASLQLPASTLTLSIWAEGDHLQRKWPACFRGLSCNHGGVLPR
jgi:penicillin-binding protein 1B